MPDKPLPFVVNDRRKFTSEGEPRPDAAPSQKAEPERADATPISVASPAAGSPTRPQAAEGPPAEAGLGFDAAHAAHLVGGEVDEALDDPNLPPAPTPEQMEQARVAFTATADRLDIAVRAANPGVDHPPVMSFEQLVQSVYMQAILQLGGGTQEGQQPQVDILGARQSIDMLDILASKTKGNLSPAEQRLLDSALFELRLAFLEITQALARSAQARATGPQAGPGGLGGPAAARGRSGPSIVR